MRQRAVSGSIFLRQEIEHFFRVVDQRGDGVGGPNAAKAAETLQPVILY